MYNFLEYRKRVAAIMKDLNKRLKQLRLEAGYKQEDIAKKLNISTSAYGYYEQGRNEPSLETMKQIAVIYDVSVDYLLGLIDTPKARTLYQIDEQSVISDEELDLIKEMQDKSLLEEMKKYPPSDREMFYRFWQFVKEDSKIREKNEEDS